MPAGKEKFPKEKADSGLAAYVAWQFDPTLSWKDIDWLCARSNIPVLLKGVLHPEDARLAIEHGAAGVIVSNHGARQLDTVPATIDALPAIVEAVDGGAVFKAKVVDKSGNLFVELNGYRTVQLPGTVSL